MALERKEKLLILEEIAREGSDSNRIAAIKLHELLAGDRSFDEDDLEALIRTK